MYVGRCGADVQNYLADRASQGVHLEAVVGFFVLHGEPSFSVFLAFFGGLIVPQLGAASLFDGFVLFARIALPRCLNEASVQNHVLYFRRLDHTPASPEGVC